MSVPAAGELPWRWEHYVLHGPWLNVAVRGLPKPQGSKSFKGMSKAGKPILAESSTAVKPWRLQVQSAVEDEMARTLARFGRGALYPFPLVGVPVALCCTFTMAKPKAAPKRRRTFPITMPDVDKLARAVMDSVKSAGIYHDDSQVVDLHARKVYPAEAPQSLEVPGLYLSVFTVAGGEL